MHVFSEEHFWFSVSALCLGPGLDPGLDLGHSQDLVLEGVELGVVLGQVSLGVLHDAAHGVGDGDVGPGQLKKKIQLPCSDDSIITQLCIK